MPCHLPAINKDVRPQSILNIAVNVEKKKKKSVSMIRKSSMTSVAEI